MNWIGGIVKNITEINDTIHFFRGSDYYIYNNGIWESINRFGINVQSIAKDNNDDIWIGYQDNGLMKLNWTNSFNVDGPASNFIGIIKKDENGNLWMTSGKFKLPHGKGFYQYNFQNWTNYKFKGAKWIWKNNSDAVHVDHAGNVWVGYWGGAVTVISDTNFINFHGWDTEGQLIVSNSYEELDIILPAVPIENRNCIPATPQNEPFVFYSVVTDFVEDARGNLWIAIHESENSQYIAVIQKNNDNSYDLNCSNWVYYGNNVGMGSGEGQVSLMEFDDFGRLWFGTFQSGIVILDYNQTLDKSIDDQIFKVGIEDNLYSNTVLCIKKDHDGVMWIGTAAGLNSYDGQNFYKHVGETGPIENKINYIFVDDFNNKWFATDGGLSILEGDKSPWEESAWSHYTTENSGLVDEIVNSVFVDSDKGEAYIGTEGGLSVFKGAFSEIRSNFDFLTGGPNPFFVDSNSRVFTITNLMVNSTVKILNINGKLIRILSEENGLVQGSRAQWDGRDSNKNIVASGIYIFLVYTEEGVVGKGKLSVIRK